MHLPHIVPHAPASSKIVKAVLTASARSARQVTRRLAVLAGEGILAIFKKQLKIIN
jgi:hypothetical protein